MITDADKGKIFTQYRTIAVYGMSKNEEKPAHYVPAFLSARGYAIIAVNAPADTLLNVPSYPYLRDIPGRIDVLLVFRPSSQVPDVVREVLERRRERGDIEVIWLQDGIYNEKAAKLAEQDGIIVIQDQCMMNEFKRLMPKQK
jgi:predicted CoA-binding protein